LGVIQTFPDLPSLLVTKTSSAGSSSEIGFDEALDRLRVAGGRITRARRSLLEDLYRAPGRVTVDELAERHADVDSATLYRVLSHFESIGLIDHVHLGHGPAGYRWVGHRSVAVVCEDCGRVVDVPADELRPLAERLRRQYGMRLSIGHFALTARCEECPAEHTHER
jgi:Fur family ferric uptake transcriptional regulator